MLLYLVLNGLVCPAGTQQSYGQGAQTDSYRDTSINQGAGDKLASAVGLGGQPTSDGPHEQYGSQSAQGTGYEQGYGQGAQTDSYRDTSSNQGVVNKLASAVGLGGQSAQNQQRDQYDNQAAQGTGYGQSYGQGYGQGAQTDSYTDNSSNQGIGSKLASAVGLGGSSQNSSGQTGTAGAPATGGGVTRSLSNLPPSASWGTAAKFAPESEETTGQYAQTANTGYGLAPVTEESTSNRATGSDTGVVDKLTTAVGLGKDSPSGQTSTGSGITGSGTHNRASEHAPASRVEDRLTEPIHTGTGTSAAADRSTYTDAGRRETPVEQSAQAFTDETAPATATETKHTPEAGISSGTGTGLGTSTGIASALGWLCSNEPIPPYGPMSLLGLAAVSASARHTSAKPLQAVLSAVLSAVPPGLCPICKA